jgi:hypothetical protein
MTNIDSILEYDGMNRNERRVHLNDCQYHPIIKIKKHSSSCGFKSYAPYQGMSDFQAPIFIVK